MKLKVYSVFDSKTAHFSNPWFDHRDESAIRNFADAVNENGNPNNQWCKHPEDFSLFLIGQFDSDLGQLIPENPKNLVTASALKAVRAEQSELPLFNGVERKAPVV